MFKIEQMSKDSNFLDESLTAGKSNLFYNTQKEEEQGKGTIRDVVENISDAYFEKMEIIKGELLINTKDNNEIKIAKELGIKVNPYDIDENGVLLSTGNNLALMDESGTVTIPDNVTEIGAGAFANEGLKTIIIPGTVKKIQANAFAYNSTLETVIMQEGVEEIGEEAFRNCSNLKNVTLPQSLIIMKGYSFLYCDSLQQVSIPEKVENIELHTFHGCYSLNKVELSEGLKKIGEGAFRDTSFSEIIIPSTVETIGNNVFFRNINLNEITINKKEGEEGKFVYENGLLMPKDKTTIIFASDKYLKNIETFKIPEGITNYTFSIYNYNNIKKIIIPETLQNIAIYDGGTFPNSIEEVEIEGNNQKFAVSTEDKILYTKDTKQIILCYSKEEIVDLEDEENSIGILNTAMNSFIAAENAKTIILPNSLQTIGNQAFKGASKNLQELKIGKNVTNIDALFKYTHYYGTVTIDSENKNYVVENNVLYTKTEPKTLVTVLYLINGTFTIDSSVKVIEYRAFHNQLQMTNIIIPEGVKEIKDSFNYCSKLQNIEIPNSVESIGANCFANCSNLGKVTIYNEKLLETAPWGATKGDKVIDLQK